MNFKIETLPIGLEVDRQTRRMIRINDNLVSAAIGFVIGFVLMGWLVR
jgi:hypothetical protein